MTFKSQIQKQIGKDVKLEVPERPELGDYAYYSPKINNFVNIYLTRQELVNASYEIPQIEKTKTVIIDYSAPNIAKPFGIGHLRSTIIGQALYNIYKSLGYTVIGDNHLGDWGTQFGKLLYQIKNSKLEIKNLSIDKLEELYVDFHKKAETDPRLDEEARGWFKKLEDGDAEAKKIWEVCVKISLKEFNRIYDLLGVKIDMALGESFYQPMLPEIIKLGKESQGAIVIKLLGEKTPLMLAKSDGGTTYAARDLAAIKYRIEKWHPDLIIYEVSVEQTLHFKQVCAAARLLKLLPDQTILYHTKHGWYLGPDGKKFSTRAGKTVKLGDILVEAIERAKKLGCKDEATAKAVGIGAVKYNDLMRSVQTDVVFDWEKIMNMQGNSGPYLQYTYARCQSVLAKAGPKRSHPAGIVVQGETLNNEELQVLRKLIHFPEVVEEAAKAYAPNLLCNYLYDLASKFNTFYNLHRIIEEPARVEITRRVGEVIKIGLNLLGIDAPERM